MRTTLALVLSLVTAISTYGCGSHAMQPTTNYCPVSGAGDVRAAPGSVFIIAGQSNALGMAPTADLSVDYRSPISNVAIWVNDHWETYQPSGVTFGPELSFFRAWSAANPDKEVGIVKCAIGGTSMLDWTPFWSIETSEQPQYGPLYPMLMGFYNASGRLPVEAVLWVQGEHDTLRQNLADVYEGLFRSFIAHLRADLGGTIPFVFGQTQHPSGQYLSVIQAAQESIALTVPVVCEALTGDVTLMADRLHFDANGQLLLGSLLYDAYARCLQN
jgi:hypothetical protein